MKYAVLKVVNGSFSIDSEWVDNLNGAIVQWHSVCRSLWNDKTMTVKAKVEIVDENLYPQEGYIEVIQHEAEQA